MVGMFNNALPPIASRLMNIVFRNFLLILVSAGSTCLAACMGSNVSSEVTCPQARDTEFAPAYLAARQNPLPASDENRGFGKKLFQSSAQPVACSQCHGSRGDGTGPMASMFNPPPRNFTCSSTMAAIPDGQLFWVIRNGSIGTSMPAFNKLSDDQIWQLILYIRGFAPLQQS